MLAESSALHEELVSQDDFEILQIYFGALNSEGAGIIIDLGNVIIKSCLLFAGVRSLEVLVFLLGGVVSSGRACEK